MLWALGCMISSPLVSKVCIQNIFWSQICQRNGLLFILYSITFNLIHIFLFANWIVVDKEELLCFTHLSFRVWCNSRHTFVVSVLAERTATSHNTTAQNPYCLIMMAHIFSFLLQYLISGRLYKSSPFWPNPPPMNVIPDSSFHSTTILQ